MCKKPILVFALTGAIAGGSTYLPAVAADAPATTASKTDKRTLLTIPYEDREGMKREMRNNLDQVRRLVAALVNEDFEAIQVVANEISLHKKRSQVVVRRGNADFTAMAVHFHGVLAPEIGRAAQTKDVKRVAQAIDTALHACVACHETFTLTEWPNNRTYVRPEPIPLKLPPGAKIVE